MKGFIIFEDFIHFITCKEILDGNYNCVISDYPNGTFSGIINRVTGASCTPEDTYDFETGALIALMKMCGFDKSYKAIDEAFSKDTFKTYATKYERELNTLKHEYDLCKNSENALKCSVTYLNKTIAKLNMAIDGYKNDLYKVSKRCIELEAKEDILNKQEKTINKREEEISVYFGGRGTGKQYKALVELFKKLDQKKVDAAYKEAYNTNLPLWQKEVLKQMYEIHEKSTKEKTIKPNDQLDSLIEGSKYAIPYADKWIKPLTKREEMWNDILVCGDYEHSEYIEVKKEGLQTFVKECNEKKIFNVNGDEFRLIKWWFDDDSCIFRIFRKPAGFVCANRVYFAREDAVIDYIPPIRWDLFKKGRIVIGIRKEHYDEFISNATKNIGTFLKHKPYDYNYTFFMYNKDSNFINAIGRSQFRQIKEMNNHKVYYWEDVR